MDDEYDALIKNRTWELVPRPPNVNVIRSMWIFAHKEKANGDFERHKARILDVKNAFLYGDIKETVYMHQPIGYRDLTHPDCVLVAQVLIWPQTSSEILDKDMAYLLLYVDDIILAASSDDLRCSIMTLLGSKFVMKDLGPLNYFLGIAVTRHKGGMFLSQRKYAEEIFDRAGMSSYKPSSTPVDTKPKVSTSTGELYADPTYFRSLAGAL
ncbi:uncharacterized mitochondrial protein AtMg00810-like [Beta vulgaris subsp. vulgaris]|uniref:uncharacterized mitochondrial protein AtMg00810-like n=1 Tax=Beta vulgaris subsp. vulgaris TaxID=3555 RepID=UPI0009006A91|nr:uncharacterized mitochondrial protein AtMg00810-like [Beta vulgaris subsp. vulgaris]